MAMDTDPEAVGLGARSVNDLNKADEGGKSRHDQMVDELMRSGGEEMEGLRLVLPRMSKGGKLFAGEHFTLEENPDHSGRALTT